MASETRSSRRAGIAIGVGIAVVAALFLLPAGILLPVAPSAVVVAVAGAVLFLPARRWWRWPVEARRASVHSVGTAVLPAAAIAAAAMVLATTFVLLLHVPTEGRLAGDAWRVLDEGGARLTVVGLGGALTYALRPVTPLAAGQWADRRGLGAEMVPAVRRELRRVRSWRTIPAVFGAALGLAPGSAYNLVLDVQGTPPSAAARDLLAVVNTWPYDPLTLALVGYLMGTVLAELTRRAPARQPGHRAHLETRTPTDYLVSAARWLPRALAAATLLAMAGATLAGSDGAWWPVGMVLLLVAAVEAVQRWVVRRPQRVDPGPPLVLDDLLRSSAAHGIAGGTSALLLITSAGAFNELAATLWAGPDGVLGGIVGVLAAVSAMALIVAVWAVWLGFGSAHRGLIPVRNAERDS